MALFLVNRYQDTDEDITLKYQNAENILKNIHQRAEERKQKRLSKHLSSQNTPGAVDAESIDSPKERKQKRLSKHLSSQNTPGAVDAESTDSPKERKQKRLSKHLSSQNTPGAVDAESIDSPKERKQKRLSKHLSSQNTPGAVDAESTDSPKERKQKRLSKHLSSQNTPGAVDAESTDSPKERKQKRLSKHLSSQNTPGAVDAESTDSPKERKQKRLSKHLSSQNTPGAVDADSRELPIERKRKESLEDSGSLNKKTKRSDTESKDVTDQQIDKDRKDEESDKSEDLCDDFDTKYGPHDVGGFTVLGHYEPLQSEKIHRVLPNWLAAPDIIQTDLQKNLLPIREMQGLDESLLIKLEENGINHFFPVQMQVLPVMLESVRWGFQTGIGGYRPSDVCCSAPTGSGKTLTFVLPVIQALKNRVVCRVRAVVVLPVVDLATQVFQIFQVYCKDTDLKVILIHGQKSFEQEKRKLVSKIENGFRSLVDVIVATPGRLVDHINKTDGFDLTHLRFLIIDEADRMMEDIKQNWLSRVENAVYKKSNDPSKGYARQKPGPTTLNNCCKVQMPFQKLLFSATLSQNPEKLQQLNLFQPKLFTSVVKHNQSETSCLQLSEPSMDNFEPTHATPNSVGQGGFIGKYTTPEGLSEFYIKCTASEKPLILAYFLHHLKLRQVLCFTNSVEIAHRLHHLIKLMGGVTVHEFSSNLLQSKRKNILRKFSSGKIDLLICSDAMARGMDVENVKYVISYTAPPYIKTYIHRVGRTARAGRPGIAFTMLESTEVAVFKRMIKEAGKVGIREMDVSRENLQPLVEPFQEALKQLPSIIKAKIKTRP